MRKSLKSILKFLDYRYQTSRVYVNLVKVFLQINVEEISGIYKIYERTVIYENVDCRR